MKLSGWSRLGVVFSMVWALLVLGVAINAYTSPPSDSSFVAWVDGKPKPWDVNWGDEKPKKDEVFDPDAYLRSKGMTQQQIDALSYKPEFRWSIIAQYVFVPILLSWILIFLFRLAVSWVADGFKK
jgi:hypothetical protein